jgi:hypothetical protein
MANEWHVYYYDKADKTSPVKDYYQNVIVLTNVFEKHTNNVPESEITLAKIYRTDFFSRYSEKGIGEEKK